MNKMSKRNTMRKAIRAMKINYVSYKNFVRKVLRDMYEWTPVVWKLEVERDEKGVLRVVNMVQDEDSDSMRFQYGIIGNSKAIRRLSPSSFKTKNKVSVEKEKDDGTVTTFRVPLGPDRDYRFFSSIIMVKFGEGIALDLLTNGFKLSEDGVITINNNSNSDEVFVDSRGYEFGAPCWGPSNEKHLDSFFYNIGERSRDAWYQFSDSLTGGAFEYNYSQTQPVKKGLKHPTRWGNYMTGSVDGPVIDLTKDYICVISREQNAMPDFTNVSDHIDPGTNIQDGGEVTNALIWREYYLSKGYDISEEDCCKLSPQVRFDFINSKVMDTVEDDESIKWRLKAVEALYSTDEDGNSCINYYGNTDGHCMLVVDTDGAKLRNLEALEEGKCTIQGVIMAYAKTSSTSTSGQSLDKYTSKDLERTKDILVKLYAQSLDEEILKKVEADFDMEASFNDNMLALMGTDALNYTEVAKGVTEDLFKFATKAIGRLKVRIDSMYSHAKFDNTYVKTIGKYGFTLYVKYLPEYDNVAIEAFNPDILDEKAEEIRAIEEDATLSEKDKEKALDNLLSCVTIKYPSAGPEEYEIIRYLTWRELQSRIDRMELTDEERYELQKYWDRSQYGVTMYAPVNILKNKLAGMDIDFDATASDFSELKLILLPIKKRVVDFIDYKDKAYK